MVRFIDPGIQNITEVKYYPYHIICFEHGLDFITYWVLRGNLPTKVKKELQDKLHTRHEPTYFHGVDGKDRPLFPVPTFHNHMEYKEVNKEAYVSLFEAIEHYGGMINPDLKNKILRIFKEK